MNRKIFLQAIPILAVMVFGCQRIYPTSRVTPMSSTSLIVYDKGEVLHTIGGITLKIKAGHFARGLYKTESGNEETGLVANLWISDNFKPQTEISILVYPGQTVIFQGTAIKILRIEMDQPGVPFIEFEISLNDQAGTPTEKGKRMSESNSKNSANILAHEENRTGRLKDESRMLSWSCTV